MDLKFLDPEETLRLLEGHKDIITPMATEREAWYKSQTCVRCGSTALKKTGDSRTLFRGNDPLPRYNLACQSCECVFDPHSGLLLRMGNLGKAAEPVIPILKGPED